MFKMKGIPAELIWMLLIGGISAASINDGPDPICHQNITLENRPVTVASPNYPRHYHPELHCQWIIIGQEGYDILVSVKEGSIGKRDDVSIGLGTDPAHLSTFNRRLPHTVKSGFLFTLPSNEIWITFVSDSTIRGHKRGFSLEIVSLADEANGKWSEESKACLQGHNDWQGVAPSINACKIICEQQTSFRCLSIEYNGYNCWNSRHNRLSSTTTEDFAQPCKARIRFLYAERLDMEYIWTIAVSGCIRSNNDMRVTVEDIESCQQRCEDETQFVCLSVEFKDSRCLLSRWNRDSVRPIDQYTQPCGWQYSERLDTAYHWTTTVDACIRLNNAWDGNLPSVEACQDRCLSETAFTCLSVEYSEGHCNLQRYNRNTIRPTNDYTQPCYATGWIYSERVIVGSWTSDLDACIRSHNMKELEVPDLDACRLICSQTEGCCSFDYRSSDQQCRLSASNRATVSPSTDYTEPCYIPGYRYSERVDKFCK